jgi:ABC-type sulfate transport system permease subunit
MDRLIIGTYALMTLAIIVTVIVLIVKRVQERKKEDFEKRDN